MCRARSTRASGGKAANMDENTNKTICYTIDEKQIAEINEMLKHLSEAYALATGEDVKITFQRLGVNYGFFGCGDGANIFDTGARDYRGVLEQADDVLRRKYLRHCDDDIPF